MALSMTGFGSAQNKNQNKDKTLNLSIQIKAVNGRFFEPKFRMPKTYHCFENELRSLLNQAFFRGNIDVFINRSETDGAGQKEVLVDTRLAKGWLDAATRLSRELKLKYTPSVEALLKVPDVIIIPNDPEVEKPEKDLVLKTFRDAMDDCLKERKREGDKLVFQLKDLLEQLKKFVIETEKKKIEIDQHLRSNLEKKIKILFEDYKLDPQRLNQEAIFLLERSDISEEIVRLKAHLDGFEKALKEKGAIGKKLDFMVQELHREVNTIGSKSQSLDIMSSVIVAKSTVEKIREQVQNIE